MRTFNFADLLEIVAETVPERIALVHGKTELSYAALNEQSKSVAAVLSRHGVDRGDQVGLQLINSPEYLTGFFGACRIGAVPFNVNYRYSANELHHLYKTSRAKALIFNRQFSSKIKEACVERYMPPVLLEVDGSELGLNLADEIASVSVGRGERLTDADLIIIYTGGTTGFPKGVMWPHKHLFFSALGGGGFFHADGAIGTPEELVTRVSEGLSLVTMPLAPLMHGAALWTTLIALFAGHKVVLSDQTNFNAAHAWQLIREQQVNIVSIVGDAMALPLVEALEENQAGLQQDQWKLDSLFHIGSGGAIFSQILQERFTNVLPNLIVSSSLGATETGTLGAGDVETDEGIMRYAPRHDLEIVVDGMRLATKGEEGVLARSGMVPVGYFGDEEKSRETFVTINGVNYALGGDAARREEDGSITLLGRGSMCINTGGEKVFPEEVESTMKAHAVIDDVLVVGLAHEKWGEQVAAIYCANVPEVDEHQLRKYCRESLADYKVPKVFFRVDTVQRNVVGKPDYVWAKSVAEDAMS